MEQVEKQLFDNADIQHQTITNITLKTGENVEAIKEQKGESDSSSSENSSDDEDKE